MRITKPRVGSGLFAAVIAIWDAYSHLNTAESLPSDWGRVAKMMADPPAFLPWLLSIVAIVALGWAFWPRREPSLPPPIEKPSNSVGGDVGGHAIFGGSNRFENHFYGPQQPQGVPWPDDAALRREELRALKERNRLDAQAALERKIARWTQRSPDKSPFQRHIEENYIGPLMPQKDADDAEPK